MKIGDLVRNGNSESGMLGIVVGWFGGKRKGSYDRCPVVRWNDGRTDWILPCMVEVVGRRLDKHLTTSG